jgi:hypothetical protein
MPTELQAGPSADDTTSVMKFGGSSFATSEHFGPVCQWLRCRLDEGGPRHHIVCVVSAPSGLTEQYRDTLLALNRTPSDRLIDAGLPLADSLGAVLFAAALQAHGIRATVALGNQIGLRTDAQYTRARLLRVNLTALRAVEHALQNRLRIVCRRNHGSFETGTVLVPDAAFQPAIVPDARSQTFEADIVTAEEAAQQLAAADVPHVLMPGTQEGTRRVVVTCGFFDAWHFLATERQLLVVKQNTLLLTRVRRDGGIERELVAPLALAARARELHDIHCAPAYAQARSQVEIQAQTQAPSPTAQPLSARLAVLSRAGVTSHV